MTETPLEAVQRSMREDSPLNRGFKDFLKRVKAQSIVPESVKRTKIGGPDDIFCHPQAKIPLR